MHWLILHCTRLPRSTDFHKYYFPASPPNPAPAVQNTMASPHVSWILRVLFMRCEYY